MIPVAAAELTVPYSQYQQYFEIDQAKLPSVPLPPACATFEVPTYSAAYFTDTIKSLDVSGWSECSFSNTGSYDAGLFPKTTAIMKAMKLDPRGSGSACASVDQFGTRSLSETIARAPVFGCRRIRAVRSVLI
jgi:hypothetical protein